MPNLSRILFAGPDLLDVISLVHTIARGAAYTPGSPIAVLQPRRYYSCDRDCLNSCECVINWEEWEKIVRFVPMFAPRPGYYSVLDDVDELGFIKRNTALGFLGKLGCIALRDSRLLAYALSSKDVFVHFHVPPGCISAALHQAEGQNKKSSWLGVDQFGFSVSGTTVPGLKPHVKANAWRLIRLAVAKEINIAGLVKQSFLDGRDLLTSVLDFIERLRAEVGSFRQAAQQYVESMLEHVGETPHGQDMVTYKAKPSKASDYSILSPLAAELAKVHGRPVVIYVEGLDSYLTIAVPGRTGTTACELAKKARDLGLVRIILSDCGKTVFEGFVKFSDDPANLSKIPVPAGSPRGGGGEQR